MVQPTDQDDRQAVATRRVGLRKIALLAVVVALATGWWHWRNRPPLPPLGDIESMELLWLRDSKTRLEGAALAIPENYWSDVLAALSPCKYDPSPAKWVVLGSIEIRTKDGQLRCIALYDCLNEPMGAFAAGPSFERRTYYRGGNSVRLREVLDKLCAEAASTNSQQESKAAASEAITNIKL